jgi:hypothetical protein
MMALIRQAVERLITVFDTAEEDGPFTNGEFVAKSSPRSKGRW